MKSAILNTLMKFLIICYNWLNVYVFQHDHGSKEIQRVVFISKIKKLIGKEAGEMRCVITGATKLEVGFLSKK